MATNQKKPVSTAFIVGAAFVSILLIWLYGSFFGIFHNDMSIAGATAGAGNKILGIVLLLAAVYIAYGLVFTKLPKFLDGLYDSQGFAAFIILLLIALSASACSGWWGAYVY